jgi:hypothetical protein
MARTLALLGLLALALLSAPAPARPAPPGRALDPGAALGLLGKSDSADALAGGLRGLLLQALPEPLYEDATHWGAQKPGPRRRMVNDGRWWKVRISAANPRDTLVLDLRDLRRPEPGRTTFTLFVSLDARVQFDRQTWRGGLRTYSGSTRARLRLKLTLRCEAQTRLEANGTLLPDAVFRLRVVGSELAYDNFVVEHTAGVGGEAAKVLGDAARAGMKQWHPSLERDLLAKANAAILKAGDTKEVRVSLLSLFGGKP